MSNILLLTVTIIYMGVAFDYLSRGQVGLGIVWIAYAVANIGFIIASRGI